MTAEVAFCESIKLKNLHEWYKLLLQAFKLPYYWSDIILEKDYFVICRVNCGNIIGFRHHNYLKNNLSLLLESYY